MDFFEKQIEIIKSLTRGNIMHNTLLAIACIQLLGINRYYRYIRRFLLPLGSGLVLYRLLRNESDENVNYLQLILSSLQHHATSRGIGVLGDAIGLYIAYNVMESINSVRSITWGNIKKGITGELFHLASFLPFVQDKLNKEKAKAHADFESELKTKTRGMGTINNTLPKEGLPHEAILKLMKESTEHEKLTWEGGKISGAIYHGETNHQLLLNQAFGYYSIANPLHPDVWPSGMKFESEIIAMSASLVKGTCDTVCGSTTSGGTESIILAIKAHRDYYRQEFGITHPELICSISAHAAVDKACDLMNIKLIKVDMNDNFEINLNSVRRHINSNTILIYSSAPSYPQGVIDPISELSALALKYNVGLHVDCCLGGFVLPFAKKLGYNIPQFDFSNPGVTSMSMDTHKYGFALKGASVILYRNTHIRQYQYFCYADWSGGIYATPTIAGSRSGGLISQCWASMMALGESGYMKHVKDIMETVKILKAGMESIKGLRLLGKTQAMIVCFQGVDGINTYAVCDRMKQKGWQLNTHQTPECAHICVTVTHVGHHDEILRDIKKSVEEVRNDPDSCKHGSAAIYGMTSSLPAGPVNDLLKIYNDVVLSV